MNFGAWWLLGIPLFLTSNKIPIKKRLYDICCWPLEYLHCKLFELENRLWSDISTVVFFTKLRSCLKIGGVRVYCFLTPDWSISNNTTFSLADSKAKSSLLNLELSPSLATHKALWSRSCGKLNAATAALQYINSLQENWYTLQFVIKYMNLLYCQLRKTIITLIKLTIEQHLQASCLYVWSQFIYFNLLNV